MAVNRHKTSGAIKPAELSPPLSLEMTQQSLKLWPTSRSSPSLCFSFLTITRQSWHKGCWDTKRVERASMFVNVSQTNDTVWGGVGRAHCCYKSVFPEHETLSETGSELSSSDQGPEGRVQRNNMTDRRWSVFIMSGQAAWQPSPSSWLHCWKTPPVTNPAKVLTQRVFNHQTWYKSPLFCDIWYFLVLFFWLKCKIFAFDGCIWWTWPLFEQTGWYNLNIWYLKLHRSVFLHW